jgi:hypothetical protein
MASMAPGREKSNYARPDGMFCNSADKCHTYLTTGLKKIVLLFVNAGV